MECLGIDLAAQPKATAICLTEWSNSRVAILDLRCGIGDDVLVDSMLAADKVGLDAPLGWPDDFVETIRQHHGNEASAPLPERRLLTLRETDRALQDATGRRPLSVSTDLIGVVALRAAELQAILSLRGAPVDRSGRGLVAEVYPAAALESWGIDASGYKSTSGKARLGEILDQLLAGLGRIEMDEEMDSELRRDHNQLDALIAALAARATALSATNQPLPEVAERVSREGWIHVPEVPLADLLSSA